MFQLRDYQQHIIQDTIQYLRKTDDPGIIELSVGGGKTLIIAHLAQHVLQKGGRVISLAHTKELVEGAYHTFTRYAPEITCGIFSASLNQKNTDCSLTYCTEKSLSNSLAEFEPIDLLIIDEAHRVNDHADTSCYMHIIAHFKALNPKLRVLGLTGTSYRLDSGSLIGRNRFFKTTIASIGVTQLVQLGFLTKPIAPSDEVECYDFSDITKQSGRYSERELNQATSTGRLTEAIIADVLQRTQDRHKVLIFASTLEHGKEILRYLPNNSGYLDGSLQKQSRETVLTQFSQGDIKYLVNKDILTTGYDEPSIDAIAILRPTESRGLLVQMIGRVLRLHPNKTDALVLDYAQNFANHGDLTDLFYYRGQTTQAVESSPDEGQMTCPDCGRFNLETARKCTCGYFFVSKHCPTCGAQNDITARHCQDCGTELIDPNERLSLKPNQSGMMVDDVTKMSFEAYHKNKGTLKVTFHTLHKGPIHQYISPGSKQLRYFARHFVDNWSMRQKVQTMDIDTLANHRELFNTPDRITFRKDGRFIKVTGWT